jgi:hypothetical protein
MVEIESGKVFKNITLLNKGREELRKFKASKDHESAVTSAMDEGKQISTRVLSEMPEHYKRAIQTYVPSSKKPYYGDLVENKDKQRGVLIGGESTLGATTVKIHDPINKKNTWEKWENVVKIVPATPAQGKPASDAPAK